MANTCGWDNEVSDEVRKERNQTVEEVQGITSLFYSGIRTEIEKSSNYTFSATHLTTQLEQRYTGGQ